MATGPDPRALRGELDQQQEPDDAGPRQQRGRRDEGSSPQEEEWREHRERDRPQPFHQHPVGAEHPGDNQASDIGGQHRLASCLGRQAAEAEQDDEQQLDLRL